MKTIQTLIMTIGVLLMITSCEINDSVATTELKELHVSLKKWNELKAKNDNSYVYSVSFASWSGYGSATEIKVVDGLVVERKYNEYVINQATGEQDITLVYTEDQAHLGTNHDGALPITIDELYNTCGKQYLVVSTQDNDVHFETSDIGMMNLCGYVPKGCMDDCFNGIMIKSFEWL
ncbi:MAG: hypothetical protein ABI663_08445 [Chryseolinea sp.]